MPALGGTRLSKLNAAHLDRLYRSPSAEGLAPASVRAMHAVLSSALNQAVRWGWIGENVADRATPPPARRARLDPPDPATVIALIEAAKRSRYPELGLFFHVAAVTGARRGELVALRWASIDFERLQVLIERAIVQVGRRVIEKDTKTHQARRLAIDVATAGLLAAHREAMDRRARMAGTEIGEQSFVFSEAPDGSVTWKPDRVTTAFGPPLPSVDRRGGCRSPRRPARAASGARCAD